MKFSKQTIRDYARIYPYIRQDQEIVMGAMVHLWFGVHEKIFPAYPEVRLAPTLLPEVFDDACPIDLFNKKVGFGTPDLYLDDEKFICNADAFNKMLRPIKIRV